jgi:hypothetical protein
MFSVRYELNFYMLFRRNSVLKVLRIALPVVLFMPERYISRSTGYIRNNCSVCLSELVNF